jgi:ABC-2 type transport system permease protein
MRFLAIISFEINYQLRRPSTWIYFLTIVVLLTLVIGEMAEYARRVEHMTLNSAIAVADLTGYANKFGLLLMAMLVGDGATRDQQSRMAPLVYTSAISKAEYLGGRYIGTSCTALLLLIPAVPLSLLAAKFTQGLEAGLFGRFSPVPFINAGLYLSLPNILIAAALLYTIVLVTRQAMTAFIGAMVLFVLSTFGVELMAGNWQLAKLADPSGIIVLDALSFTLSAAQKNSTTIPFSGFLLANRVLWLGISAIVGGIGFLQFQFVHTGLKPARKGRVRPALNVPEPPHSRTRKISSVKSRLNAYGRALQTWLLAIQFFKNHIYSFIGLAIPAIAVFAFVLIPNLSAGPMGVPIVPEGARIAQFLNGSALQIFIMLFISLAAGQLIWRERDARLDELSDTAPFPIGLMVISKYLTLALLLLTVQIALLLAAIAIQFVAGYSNLDIMPLLQTLFVFQLTEYLTFAAVAMSFHVFINQKYIGHLAVMLLYLFTVLAPRIGIEHKLLIFESDTGLANSSFYGQSAFLLPWLLFKVYWAAFALLLIIMAKYMWPRGKEINYRRRTTQAVQALKHSPVCLACLVILVCSGAVIFYNINILNHYKTVHDEIIEQATYERTYRRYKEIEQPVLKQVKLSIELYPKSREAVVEGSYLLENNSGKPISFVHVEPAPEVKTTSILFHRKARLISKDQKLRHYIYKLESALLPGESVRLAYQLNYRPAGFSNRGVRTSAMENGSFIKNYEWLPAIGYQASRELQSPRSRKEAGLPERPEYRSLHDSLAIMDRYGRERIQLDAVIGTENGQTAIIPGELKNKWTKGSRQYFHYVTEAPILNMYHIYSANYALRKSRRNGTEISIYYLPQHTLNLSRIDHGIEAALDYYSKNFSAYQYHQLRFVEYPDPGTGGISLPGTIGYSSNFSQLDANKDPRGFDLPFAVTAHETAHQWWGHQLNPADVQGSPLLTESLAWYSALGVVEQTYGPRHLRSLLDAMRLDYLNPRSLAAAPLLKATDKFQAYRKGPFAMYALREYIGEKKVNLALKNLLLKFKSAEPPFATSMDLYKELRAVSPASLQYLLSDLFKQNTFWELKAKRVNFKPTGNGNWLVTLVLDANKVQVNLAGEKTEVQMNDLIEIGAFENTAKAAKKPLYLKMHRIHSGVNILKLEVHGKPSSAGIDPRHLLIDTNTLDNMITDN